MADNPYAKYQQDDQEQTQPATPAAKSAESDPYAKYQNTDTETGTQPKEEKPGVASQLYDKAANVAGKADEAITGALAPNPENTQSFMKTNTREVPKTLGREVYETGKSALGMIPGAYHAFADPATEEEKAEHADFEKEQGEEPGAETSGLKRIGLGIERMSGIPSAQRAAKIYANPETRPTYEQALSVAPEALGQGAGTVVGGEMIGKGLNKGIDVAKENAPLIKEKATAPLRAGAKAVNAAKNNPEVTGAVAGGLAGAGHGPIGVGIGAVEGARGGGMVNRFLKKVPDLNENFGKRPTPEQQNLVGNEYTPAATEPVPPAKAGALPRIEYATPTEHAPAEPNLVGNEHAEGEASNHEAPVEPKGALGRIEYGTPTEHAAPKEEGLVGNEHTEGNAEVGKPAPTKPRIEYVTPTEHTAPREEGLVGNEHTEQQKPAGEVKPSSPIKGVEYGEHQPAATTPDKEITKEMVKSTPGTSMSPEGKAKAQAADQVHVDKAREELGEAAPMSAVLDRAKEIKEEAATKHEETSKTAEENDKAATDAQMEAHEASGGSTFTPDGKDLMGEDKYSVGQYPDRTKSYGDDFTDHDLAQFKKDNADLLKQPDHAVGTWKDPDTGKHVLDVVKLFGDRDEAIAAGKAANQKGIFGLKGGEYIDTGGTGEGAVDEAKAQSEAEKASNSTAPKANAASESKTSPEDVSSVNNVVKDLAEQDIIKAGKKYDVDHEDYDFKKRDENRHRVERDQYAKDVTEAIPDEMKRKLVKAEQDFDDEDSNVFDQASRNSASKAARAKAIWDKAHEPDFEAQAAEKMNAKGPAPEATTETAKMSDAELLKHGFTKEDIEAGKHLPEVGGGGKGKATGLAAEKGIPEAFAKNMTPEEIASVTKTDRATQSFLDTMSRIPDVQEYTDIALAGEGARKWYQRSASAFDAMKEEAPTYFDQDGDKDKFIGLLASSSPRQSVAMNMRETLGAWKAYVDAGRPEGEALKTLLRDQFTLPNTKVPNAMKALAGEKMWPDLTKNTAFKAPSFERNLRGWLDYGTNDGWMALFGGLDPAEISKPTSYHPLSVATRAAAKALGWETAEAQAAIWSFTQALTERGEELPEEIRRQSEDFADILANDPQTRQLVSDLGVNLDQLDTRLKAIGEKPEVTGRTTGTTSRSIGKLKGRIEEARGKGAIPPSKSAQGDLSFREPHATRAEVAPTEEGDTSFEPEKLEEKEAPKPKGKANAAIPLNKLYDRSAVLVDPHGKLMSIPEYDPRSESPQHPELLRKSGYKGDLTKFLKEGGVRAYTTGPEEAGVEIQNDSPDTIQRALRVVDGLDREKTRFEIADPKTFRTTFSATGTYSQIKNALDNRK